MSPPMCIDKGAPGGLVVAFGGCVLALRLCRDVPRDVRLRQKYSAINLSESTCVHIILNRDALIFSLGP